MEEIEKQVGLEQARWFWQQSLQAVELVDERVKKHRNRLRLAARLRHRRRPQTALEELQQWHEHARQHYGATHYQLWDKATLKQQLASDMYLGAQFDPHSGHLHPLNYTLASPAPLPKQARRFSSSPR